MGNLMKDILIGEVCAGIGAATGTDENTDRLDMSGYDGVIFITPIILSVSGGVATLTVEASTTNADTYMAAITSAVATKTSATANTLLIVDVYKPLKRYVQGVLTSATQDVTFGNTIAIRYKGSKYPITADSTVAASASVIGS